MNTASGKDNNHRAKKESRSSDREAELLDVLNSLERIRLKRKANILSLDWDWWTGDCGEHSGCCGFCDNAPELSRGNEKLARRIRKPESRIRRIGSPIATVVAECHADMLRVARVGDRITVCDAHDDREPCDGEGVSCQNWAWFLHLNELTWIDSYPKTIRGDFDLVFLCRSAPWTPEKLNPMFYRFAGRLAKQCKYKKPVFFGHAAEELEEGWLAVGKQAQTLER